LRANKCFCVARGTSSASKRQADIPIDRGRFPRNAPKGLAGRISPLPKEPQRYACPTPPFIEGAGFGPPFDYPMPGRPAQPSAASRSAASPCSVLVWPTTARTDSIMSSLIRSANGNRLYQPHRQLLFCQLSYEANIRSLERHAAGRLLRQTD
jgi:hypothetical protein